MTQPVPFEQAFTALRPHLGNASTLVLGARTAGLAKGEHAVTWFDWSAMSADARATFAESQLDQQTDGVLLLDLRHGGAVVYCAGASSTEAVPLAPSAAVLVVR